MGVMSSQKSIYIIRVLSDPRNGTDNLSYTPTILFFLIQSATITQGTGMHTLFLVFFKVLFVGYLYPKLDIKSYKI